MDFNFTSNKFKFVTNHTFHIMENISFDEQSMGVNNSTTEAHMMALYFFFFLIVEIPGNLLLLSMIYYEKYGMDPHKRTVTNKLLTSICVSFLLQNVIGMPILMFNRIDPHPTTKCKKIFKWGCCGLILKGFYLGILESGIDVGREIIYFYRVFKLDMHEIKHLLGHQKCTFKL